MPPPSVIPPMPDRAGVAEAGRQAVLGGGRRVRRRRSARAGPGRPRLDVDVDAVDVAQVEHDPAVDDAVAGAAVAAAADGELEAGLPRDAR